MKALLLIPIAIATLAATLGDRLRENAATVVATVPVTVVFNPSPSTNAVGYKIYSGTAHTNYTRIVDVGTNLTAKIEGFTIGQRYYFAATAYDSDGQESLFSNELTAVAQNETFISAVSQVAQSSIGPWTNVAVTWSGVATSNQPALYVGHSIIRSNFVTWK